MFLHVSLSLFCNWHQLATVRKRGVSSLHEFLFLHLYHHYPALQHISWKGDLADVCGQYVTPQVIHCVGHCNLRSPDFGVWSEMVNPKMLCFEFGWMSLLVFDGFLKREIERGREHVMGMHWFHDASLTTWRNITRAWESGSGTGKASSWHPEEGGLEWRVQSNLQNSHESFR